jgi:hypothetical protein
MSHLLPHRPGIIVPGLSELVASIQPPEVGIKPAYPGDSNRVTPEKL